MPFVAVGRAGTIGGCGPLRCGAAAVRPDESAAPASRGNGLRRTFRCGRDVPAAALAIERGQQANVEGWAGPRMAAYIAKKQKLEAEQRAAEQAERAEPAAGR